MKRWLIIFLALFGTLGLQAKEAAPRAENELTEKRLIAISSELRCLVCQNESLAGSNAELAQDLRREIRGLINEGKSDGEVMDFMVSRYGDFVRYRPPLKGTTLLLWFGPAALFLIALVSLVRYLRRRDKALKDSPLSADEQRQADLLLQTKDRQP
jgi:cytochrome c-type biogenesis protein CcmH